MTTVNEIIRAGRGLAGRCPSPVVYGLPGAGNTLFCTTGTWFGTGPITQAYQWMRGGVSIGGATSPAYASVAADAGPAITCAVTVIGAANPSGSATSNALRFSFGQITPAVHAFGWDYDAANSTHDGSLNLLTATDLSGNGRTLLAGVATPVWNATGSNSGKGCADFNGSLSQYMETAAFTLSQPHAIFISAKRTVLNTDQYMVDGRAQNTAALYTNVATPNLFAGTSLGATVNTAINTWYVYSAYYNDTSSQIAWNGASRHTGAGGSGSASGVRVGASGAPTAVPLFGSVRKIVGYTGSLSANDISNIEHAIGYDDAITVT